MARVRVEGLTKKFGDVVAVDHISFEARNGEFVCLLGPSGCGKTTTLRCIAGLEKQDEGDIYVGDMLVNDLPPKDRNTAMVFQFYAMFPGMNAFEQIAFPLRVRKVPKDEIKTRVREVAEMLHIDDTLEKPVSRLAIDQRQRLAIARAIIREPEVYLLDEPLTNLDAQLRLLMRAELKKLLERLKTTTIYVTHDQIEAMSLADRIATMNLGKILQYDTPDVVYNYPKSLFVAGFIGSPPMNFIDCSFVKKDGKAFLDATAFTIDVSEFKDLIRERATSSELILGARPEDTLLLAEQVDDSFKAEVYIIEQIGDRTIVNLKVGESIVKANVLGTFDKDVGARMWVAFNKNKMHIFDKKTEEVII